jgi:peptide/nickel transport system permease protein
LVTAILLEAGLSFLGLGVTPPMPSWGAMVQESYPYLLLDKGLTMALFPGLAVVLLIFSLNLTLEYFKKMNFKQP